MNEITQAAEATIVARGVSPEAVRELLTGFAPHFEEFLLVRQGVDAVGEDPQAARAARLDLRRVRVAADKTRKALKEDSLRRGQAIDALNNLLLEHLKPLEQQMDDIENAEKRRRDALQAERAARVAAYLDDVPGARPDDMLAELSEGAFDLLLQGAAADRRRRDEQREQERQRLQQEQEQRERDRQRLAEIEAEQAKARQLGQHRRGTLYSLAGDDSARAAGLPSAETLATLDEQAWERTLRAEREAAEQRAEARRLASAGDGTKLYALISHVSALRAPSFGDAELTERVSLILSDCRARLEALRCP